MDRTSIIVQARTGSSRLPNKMIKIFFEGKTLLEIILLRLKEAGIPIILATTSNSNDDVIETIAEKHKVAVFRGDEDNVLNRFIDAGEYYGVNKIIRICADNPLLDISALRHLCTSFEKSNVDYWCYSTKQRIPTIKTHYGFWGEGVSLAALKKIKSLTKERLYEEHVTNYIYSHPDSFVIHYEPIDLEIENYSLRLTIDTIEDFELVSLVYSQIIAKDINQSALDISRFVSKNLTWRSIMNNEIVKNIK